MAWTMGNLFLGLLWIHIVILNFGVYSRWAFKRMPHYWEWKPPAFYKTLISLHIGHMLAPALPDMLSAFSQIGFRKVPCSRKITYCDKKDNNLHHETSLFDVISFSFTSLPSYSAPLPCGVRIHITCSCLVVAKGQGSELLLHPRTKICCYRISLFYIAGQMLLLLFGGVRCWWANSNRDCARGYTSSWFTSPFRRDGWIA